jgi:hypothetical protein
MKKMLTSEAYTWGIVVLIAVIHQSHSIRVLTIGDSIDRLTVLDWCSELHGQKEKKSILTTYARDKLQSSGRIGRFGGYVCVDLKNNNSLSSFSIFGSNRTGPYWMSDAAPDRRNIITDTASRLNLGLDEYFSKFPPPHRIFLQTAQWDNAHLIRNHGYAELNRRGSELWNTSISIFEKALNDRIDQVLQLVSNYTTECGPIQVGLRTAIFSPNFEPFGSKNLKQKYIGEARDHQLLFEMNDVIRHIAKSRDLILYDGDTDFWTTYEYKYQNQGIYFRDYVHPREIYTATFGEKMMSLQYSKYLVGMKNKTCLEFPQLWLHSNNFSQLPPKFITKVYIIHTYPKDHGNQSILVPLNNEQEQYALNSSGILDSSFSSIRYHRHNITPETSFYIIYDSVTNLMQSRHCNATDFNFQQNLRLGFGDMISVTQEELSDVKKGSPVPWILRGEHLGRRLFNFSTHASAAIVGLTSPSLYILNKGSFRKLTFPYTNETMLFHLWDLEENVGQLKGMQLDNLPRRGDNVPDIYRSNLLIRYSQQKEIFWITINGSIGIKRPINSMQVAMKYGFDLNQVIVVNDLEDIDMIPTGEPLMT